MTPDSPLARAFRLTKSDPVLSYSMQGYKAPTFNGASYSQPHDGEGVAMRRLRKARDIVGLGKPIYGGTPGAKHYPEQGDALRFAGRVVPDSGRDWLDTRDSCGWHTDPHGDVFRDGSGLCFGVVYQLPGRKGVARFVAGYQFGGVDGGPTLDLETVYTVKDETEQEAAAYYSGATAAADSMAKAAGERERDYQTAWQAGSQYAQAKEEATDARRECLDVLAERRAVKGSDTGEHPALCRAIRGTVSDLCATIRDARERMAELAAGDYGSLIFYPDTDAQTAFCEGAGLDTFPA